MSQNSNTSRNSGVIFNGILQIPFIGLYIYGLVIIIKEYYCKKISLDHEKRLALYIFISFIGVTDVFTYYNVIWGPKVCSVIFSIEISVFLTALMVFWFRLFGRINKTEYSKTTCKFKAAKYIVSVVFSILVFLWNMSISYGHLIDHTMAVKLENKHSVKFSYNF